MKLRTHILLFLFLFAFAPLFAAFIINLPLVLDRFELFYHKAHLQNLRADFRDLDQHLASRHELVSLLAKLPEPGSLLRQTTDTNKDKIQQARQQYTIWINHILRDQQDIVQLTYLNQEGEPSYTLLRNHRTGIWEIIPQPFVSVPVLDPGKQPQAPVIISPISIRKKFSETDPRFFMTLTLSGQILNPVNQDQLLGNVVMTVDVGGIARYYKDTIWVQDNGQYLFYHGQAKKTGSAFDDYPTLESLFEKNKLALMEYDRGKQIIWVPLLQTVEHKPLWVGRQVDPSPIADIQWAITWRVALIMLILVFIVFFLAIRFARKVEKFDHELTEGISTILEDNLPIELNWGGPQEIRELSDKLSKLSRVHSDNTKQLVNHAKQLEDSVAARTMELEQARQHLENIITHIGEALLVLGPDGKVKSSNPAASKMLGYSPEQLQDMPIGDLFEEEGEEQAAAFMGTWLEALIRTGVMQQIDAQFRHSNGSTLPIRFTRTAIKDENGEITDILCIARDMTGFTKTNTDDE